MSSRFVSSLENIVVNCKFFRYGFFVLLVLVPLATKVTHQDISSLYILTLIFLGLGFSEISKPVLFLLCTFVVFARSFVDDGIEHIEAMLCRLISFTLVVFISATMTKHYHKIKKQEKELTIALAKALDSRDSYTANHSENVANYAIKIAKEMNLNATQCEDINTGGLLHDIGKIGVPEHILMKADKLTAEEYELIKLHPVIGYETLKHISDFKTNGILDIVLFHHERYDGKGYPKGLKGEQIPLFARIVSVADSFDAMASRRLYRNVMALDDIMSEIDKNKGTQFDPQIVEVFIKLLKIGEIKIRSEQ
ncbi:HD-GYP domain-containing protein [Paenibacillus cremeus]|uniref:HD-GYP domain-containing protein n=1 Tax=Paenibacillus cremeus TaxID=2163881 RepID=UPI0021BD9F29|nr:HD-GYP domain-containing protein [Paenibacillus cremeus]